MKLFTTSGLVRGVFSRTLSAIELRKLWAGLLAAAVCLFLSGVALSQGIATGSISGTVVDASGGTLPGASVKAVNTATNQEFTETSNQTGLVALRSVPPGTYKVTISAKSFRTVVLENIEVSVSRDSGLGTVKMELGPVGEVVQVEGGGAPLIETSTAQVTTSFETRDLTDLPLGGSFDQVTLLIPGVADSGRNSFSNTNGAAFSSNGLRGRSNNFQIDGQPNNDNSVAGPSIFLGNQDALDEVSVITNDFGVEYGHASGSVVNYVTKSGTNEFHGSGFEYFTGSRFDSHSNLDQPALDPTLPKFVENRFGGTIGGPIKHDKAWFFFSPYFDRVRQGGTPFTSGTNPTPTPMGLTELATAFPNNPAVAALNAIGPYAVKLGNPQPLATQIITVSNGTTSAPIQFAPVERSIPSLFNDREFDGRVDVQATSKDRLSARYIFQQSIQTAATGAFAAGGFVDIPARDQQIALDWTRTISTRLVNQLRYSFSRAGFGFQGGSFPNCLQLNIFACPTGITLQSGVNLGIQNNLPQGRIINNTEVQDNASFILGRHTIKFGGEFYKQRSPNIFLPSINGTYTFSSGGSAAGGSCRAQFPGLPAYTGNICSFSRFLADAPLQLALTNGPPKFQFKEFDVSGYVGDDWRVNNNLTLNFGLRWEFYSQAINLLHDLSVANQAGPNAFWDNSLPTNVKTVPAVPNHYDYFEPNVGFAWKPHVFGLKGDKTVIRAGYRLTFDPAFYNIFLNEATAAPVVNAGVITAGAALPTTGFLGSDVRTAQLGNIPTGPGINPGTRLNTRVSGNFGDPYTQEWSLGVQQELTSHVVFESRYVGNHVVGNFQTLNTNPSLTGLVAGGFSSFIPAGITPCSTPKTPGFASGRVDCNFTNVRTRANTAFSDYHGLQNELRIQNWHGLSAGLAYTFSKTEDNTSEIFSTVTGGATVAGAQNPFDTSRGEKALSGLDFPQTASLYFVYDLPFYKSRTGFLGRLFGGYQVNGTFHYSSGQLWSPVETTGDANSACQNSFDLSFYGVSTCRPFNGNTAAAPDTVGQCTNPAAGDCGLVDFYTGKPTTVSAVRWILNNNNAAAFFKTPYGNSSRSPGYRGDPVNAVNLSVFKTTKISERFSLRLEGQAYNLFNHRFLGVPDPVIEDGNLANGGTFGNNFSNNSGGGYTNATLNGYGRRRVILGAKVTF